MMKTIPLFDKNIGNASHYRIPAMVSLGNNKVVACADERFFGCGDNPNRIDKVVRISDDNGVTWGKQITAVEEIGTSKMTSSAAIDPTLLYDKDTDTLFLLYCHTPAGVGILNCRRTTGYEDGYKVIRNKRTKYQLRGDKLFLKGKDTGITVDEKGCVSTGGNIYDGSSEFKEESTSFLMLCTSSDQGETWSKPICLNEQVKGARWGFIGACPGVGIKLKEGKHKGRLIFPIYYGLRTAPINITFSCIYSDDKGKTWKTGKTPLVKGRITPKNPVFLLPAQWLSETQVVELGPDNIMAIMRNHHPKKRAMYAHSTDGGETFGYTGFLEDIPQPICQISAISFDYNGKRLVATLNAASEKKRENGVLRISDDLGKTFPYSLQIKEGEFVYSSIALLDDGYIGIAYEDSTLHEQILFTKVHPSEVYPH